MLELAGELLARLRAGERLAAVTVTAVGSSAPRGVGATMAVTASGEIIGSISGGCVEGDALVLGLNAIASGSGRFARFGFTDEIAHTAGLACGGTIEVVAYPVRTDDPRAIAALESASRDEATAIGLVVHGDDLGRLVAPTMTDAGVMTLQHARRPRLVVLGASEYATALCRVAAVSGFAVTICDPWAPLVTRERFPDATELTIEEPAAFLQRESSRWDERTAVVVLTHDERLDVPALVIALRLPIAFVGALGARATVARRAQLLRAAGVEPDDLARLHSPLGLDLGAVTPEETALSILAEIVAARRVASGLPLRERTGPLHRRSAPDDPAISHLTPDHHGMPHRTPTADSTPAHAGSCSAAPPVTEEYA